MLKLLSLNIEGDNHLDAVTGLVAREDPDIVCFNEAFEADVDFFKKELNLSGLFFPAVLVKKPNKYRISSRGKLGTLVLSKSPILSSQLEYYDGDPKILPELTNETGNAPNRFLVTIKVKKEGEVFEIVTTHFTITRGGVASALQRRNMKQMIGLLDQEKDFALCGDFNAPRGGEIFSMLADKFHDCIPPEISTTLDRTLHRDGKKRDFPDFVVDGLFTRGKYQARNVRVVCGVSDHCAILAELQHAS